MIIINILFKSPKELLKSVGGLKILPLGSKSKGGEAQRGGHYCVLNAFCALWLFNHTVGYPDL